MRGRRSFVAASALWLVFAGGLGFSLMHGGFGQNLEEVPIIAAFAAFPTVGLVVAARRPRSPIGWIFLAIGVLTGIGSAGEAYARQALTGPGPPSGLAVLAGWTQLWFWYPLLFLAVLFTPLLFPSGLPSRRWRPVLWVSVVAGGATTVMAALSPTIEAGGREVPNPIGVELGFEDIEETLAFEVLTTILAVAILAAVVSLILRFRGARGEERQQLKWFALAALLVGAQVLASILFPSYERSDSSNIVFGLVLASLPLSCGIAITRYRLYDIDLIINRTLVYGALSAFLGVGYFGSVVLLQQLLSPITVESDLAIAGSTLAVAALFRPARARFQGFIDRRFYRRKYDAGRTLEAFSIRLRDKIDLDALTRELVTVVTETIQPVQASLWLRNLGVRRAVRRGRTA